MNQKRFQHKNPPFQCENCRFDVPPASKTCRNHCPECFHSKHVDILPGDRANPCKGLMKPISYEWKNSNLTIEFECMKCKHVGRNKAALDDQQHADEIDRLIDILGS